MKIAISGKGGVGKTTLAGIMARILAEKGYRIFAIDADPDSNLASALGIAEEKLRNVRPLAQMEDLIEERTGARKGSYGGFFKINPKVDDLPERFSIEHHGVKLLILGTIPKGGGGCFCPESTLLKSFLSHLLVERDEYVIVDMEAGLEHLGRGSVKYIDGLIVVVEPGKRSIQTANQIKRLALDLSLQRLFIVGNKIRDEEERRFLEENLKDFEVLGFISYSDKIVEADRLGVSPYELDEKVRRDVEQIIKRIEEIRG